MKYLHIFLPIIIISRLYRLDTRRYEVVDEGYYQHYYQIFLFKLSQFIWE